MSGFLMIIGLPVSIASGHFFEWLMAVAVMCAISEARDKCIEIIEANL